ncbi:MAG: hypothetical protein NT062_39460, partial [Proteobacteria bacterium]|nr:hypothetical protein [Pseudomonadota bacterium]
SRARADGISGTSRAGPVLESGSGMTMIYKLGFSCFRLVSLGTSGAPYLAIRVPRTRAAMRVFEQACTPW